MMNEDRILEVRHFSKRYRKGLSTFEAVRDVSFSVGRGEILGIVGESGSGKSTMLKSIACLENPSEGEIFLNGRDISRARSGDVCRELQMVFQDPARSFDPRMKTGDSVRESLRKLTGLRGEAAEARVLELCELTGLAPELADRYPGGISGGQCQRFAIARALAAEPKLLLCDEVTSALDVLVQAQIISLLADLQKRLGLSIVFVSHDIALVSEFCDRILVMKNGREIEQGPAREIVRDPSDEYTRQLLGSVLSF